MPDLKVWTENARTIAAAVELQLHGGIAPDESRALADRIVRAVDRAGKRGKADAIPTADETMRAHQELGRRGHEVPLDDVFAALDAALSRSWGR